MEHSCRVCETPIFVAEGAEQATLVRCAGCHGVFDSAKLLRQADRSEAPRPPESTESTESTEPGHPGLQLLSEGAPNWPRGFRVEPRPAELLVLWPWRRSQGRAFLVGVLFIGLAVVTGIEAYVVIGPLAIPTHDPEARPHLVALSAGSLYIGLAFLLNRSKILVRRSLLQVRHGPLPFLWSRKLTPDVIDQLYCKERRKEWEDEEGHEHLTVSFSLVAALRSGRRVTLLSGLESADQVLWLERAFESMLAIEDRPVAGESFLSAAKPGRP